MNYKKKLVQNENNTSTDADEVSTAATAATGGATAKEKKGWFHSLTRRKKTLSQTSINCGPTTTAAKTTANTTETNEIVSPEINNEDPSPIASHIIQTNNNNEPLMRSCNATTATAATGDDAASADIPSCSSSSNSGRKRKDEKNAFQRFRKRMGLRFPSLRRLKHSSIDGATTDASSEFLTHSPIHEPLHFNFKRSTSSNCATAGFSTDETDMIPFTNDFKQFIKKKWLERDGGPNWIMYEASCEMLKYVLTGPQMPIFIKLNYHPATFQNLFEC